MRGLVIHWLALILLAGVASMAACGARIAPPAAVGTCLPDGTGYLRATLRGAIDSEINWRDVEMRCEGGPRPEGGGLRLSLLGPVARDGRQLRLIVGLAAAPPAPVAASVTTPAAVRAANVTVIVEGAGQLYSTRGDTHCTVEQLQQRPLGLEHAGYRVSGRGFCVDPATTLDGSARLYIDRFDFAGRIDGTG